MPRDDDPRVVIRLTPEDHAALKATAELNNLAVGALVRECAIRYASTVARELRVSGKRLRRGRVPDAGGESRVPGVESRAESVLSPPRSKSKPRGPAKPIEGLKRASELLEGGTQAEWDLGRQARLNEARDRKAKGGP